jgi:2-keto-4-pentenoate hydratase/2-oxohepta-3-ene-1,7-dioic acid hydratase in catechol pathway
MVTADEIPEPKKMVLTTRLNGDVMQHSGFDLMAWDLAELVSYISDICTLLPGDVIATGTPAGVGMGFEPPRWLREGDVVRVEIDGIGAIENRFA